MTSRKRAAEPPPSALPRNLSGVVIWALGVALTTVLLVGGIYVLVDHNKAVQKEHDDQFATRQDVKEREATTKQTIKDHERDDIYAIKALAEQTNKSIGDLTTAINQVAVNSDVSRQYLFASNRKIEASLTDLIARQCRKDNPKEGACRAEEQTAADARTAATKQAETAQSTAAVNQSVRVTPPVIVVPAPTK